MNDPRTVNDAAVICAMSYDPTVSLIKPEEEKNKKEDEKKNIYIFCLLAMFIHVDQ